MSRSVDEAPPLVTTIIPTYRRPGLLKRAIASSLEQTGPAHIVRVFDNASGDETGRVVEEMASKDPRLAYHCHQENLGAYANFEFGLRSVETPFFSILSDDDYLLPGFYSRAIRDLQDHPEAMFWAGMTLSVDDQGRIWDARVDRWSREGLFEPPEGLMSMMHGMAPIWTGIVFRRDVLHSIGLPDREALGPSDLDFVLKASAAHPFVLRKYPSAVFTLNPSSFSATQPLSSFWPGWLKMLSNLEGSDRLDQHAKAIALEALRQDARQMLFRRGANALSLARYDFTQEAAQALRSFFGDGWRASILAVLAWVCERFGYAQGAYTRAYRFTERRLVESRSGLESRFGHLLRRT